MPRRYIDMGTSFTTSDTPMGQSGPVYEHVERRIDERLSVMDRRLEEIVKVTNQLARNEERMNGQIERVDRIERKYDQLERDFYGPEGLLVQHNRNMSKTSTQLALVLTAGSIAVQFAIKYFGG